jgi:hypothetical protein
MDNKDMPAMPLSLELSNRYEQGYYDQAALGLTKREHFAGLMMQSYMIMCAGADNSHVYAEEAAQEAVEYADALLAELDKAK